MPSRKVGPAKQAVGSARLPAALTLQEEAGSSSGEQRSGAQFVLT